MFYDRLYKDNYLEKIKKEYETQNVFDLYVTLELSEADEMGLSLDKGVPLETLYEWYKESEEKKEKIVFELDEEAESYIKYGQHLIDLLSFTPEEIQRIKSNIQDESESFGYFKIITDTDGAIKINSNDIADIYLASEWNETCKNT